MIFAQQCMQDQRPTKIVRLPIQLASNSVIDVNRKSDLYAMIRKEYALGAVRQLTDAQCDTLADKPHSPSEALSTATRDLRGVMTGRKL